MDEVEEISLVYENTEALRLDKVLVSLFLDLEISRSKAQKLIESGFVKVNKAVQKKSSFEVDTGDLITLNKPEPVELILEPYDFSLDIILEDEELLVINKPAGLTVHPGAGNKKETLVNALIFRQVDLSPSEDPYRPGIVHRLDKDTTGLLVVAKTEQAHRKLSEQFKDRTARRIYKSLCLITPRRKAEIANEKEGTIDAPIGRHSSNRTKMSVGGNSSREARTHWRVSELFYYAALMDLKLDTGRTHQIRVHMEHIGAPVIGDLQYGNFEALPRELFEGVKKFGRQALHAGSLEFIHPKTNEKQEFSAPLPDDFIGLIELFRKYDAKLSSV